MYKHNNIVYYFTKNLLSLFVYTEKKRSKKYFIPMCKICTQKLYIYIYISSYDSKNFELMCPHSSSPVHC